jgi:hypothetical protein
MDDRTHLPVSEERVFEIARRALSREPPEPWAPRIDPDVPLRIDNCHARRRAEDGAIIGFVVTVLVDPQLGVAVRDPTAEPRWYSRTALVLHLDKDGGRHDGTLT